MADNHLQVNYDGTTTLRKTAIWPSSKLDQTNIIKKLFEHNSWSVSEINNIKGSYWKIITKSCTTEYKIKLYISSIRDESRKDDEFKMQLGDSYPIPTEEENDWITIILGIYTISDGENPNEYILCGYTNINNYDFSTNTSLRGTRTNGLQMAKLFGMYYNTKNNIIIFRPEFIYHYISLLKNISYTPKAIDTETYFVENNIYISALRTKPFLLLAGISGTGKSQKVQELAFMTCPRGDLRTEGGTTPGNYCLIEVKPNWHDSTELLGYYNALSGRYELTDFIRFTYKAIQHPDTPFFLCLDEMNLAPVEQYFAEYLSVLETRKKIGDKIETQPLLSKDKFANCELHKNVLVKEDGDIIKEDGQYKMEFLYSENDAKIIEYLKLYGLQIPDNLFVIGTVNMDDTTHQFSRKVIDRAFTIEMNGGKMSDMFSDESKTLLEYRDIPIPLEAFKSKYVRAYEILDDPKYDSYTKKIIEDIPALLGDSDGSAKINNPQSINGILNDTPFRVSYRVQNELVLYLSVLIENADFPAEIDDLINQATLAILMEKVLPRIQGEQKQLEIKLENGEKSNILRELKKFVENRFKPEEIKSDSLYNKVINKLNEMDRKLSDYYTNFF